MCGVLIKSKEHLCDICFHCSYVVMPNNLLLFRKQIAWQNSLESESAEVTIITFIPETNILQILSIDVTYLKQILIISQKSKEN